MSPTQYSTYTRELPYQIDLELEHIASDVIVYFDQDHLEGVARRVHELLQQGVAAEATDTRWTRFSLDRVARMLAVIRLFEGGGHLSDRVVKKWIEEGVPDWRSVPDWLS